MIYAIKTFEGEKQTEQTSKQKAKVYFRKIGYLVDAKDIFRIKDNKSAK